MESIYSKYAPFVYIYFRVIVGLLFACHGAQKLFGVFGGIGYPGMAIPLFSLIGLAGIIELVGGVMIALGVLARFAAFIASGEMAVAYFSVHFPRGFWPIVNGGELAVVYCFCFLYIASEGSGRWSIGRTLRKRKAQSLVEVEGNMTT